MREFVDVLGFLEEYGVLINLVIQAILFSGIVYFVYLIVQGVISWRNSDSSADLKKAIGNIKRSIIGLAIIISVLVFHIFVLSRYLIS